jgi:hypothetical protein
MACVSFKFQTNHRVICVYGRLGRSQQAAAAAGDLTGMTWHLFPPLSCSTARQSVEPVAEKSHGMISLTRGDQALGTQAGVANGPASTSVPKVFRTRSSVDRLTDQSIDRAH